MKLEFSLGILSSFASAVLVRGDSNLTPPGNDASPSDPDGGEETPIGTASDCCCGDRLATGGCCVLNQIDATTCAPSDGEGVDCFFLDLGAGGSGSCPEGGFRCDSSIICPPLFDEPTPTPSPTMKLPDDRDSCGDVTDFGSVDSSETCQEACEEYGLYCSVEGNISVCGSEYLTFQNICGDTQHQCFCGSSFQRGSRKLLCEDMTELPPLECGDKAPGVTSEETCKASCEASGTYCQPDGQGGTQCGSRFVLVNGYQTCYCGPAGSERVICGDACADPPPLPTSAAFPASGAAFPATRFGLGSVFLLAAAAGAAVSMTPLV